ncbi:MAG TPA: hypothetical protein VHC90_22130 [Bryobacteraceae bacterium]|nr:hypothetical protein [Bryobacteraceae bacterium]
MNSPNLAVIILVVIGLCTILFTKVGRIVAAIIVALVLAIAALHVLVTIQSNPPLTSYPIIAR